MAVSKKDRIIIFNKFGGKCSYCGEPLVKGWHVDHAEPIIRLYKTIPASHIDGIWTPHKIVANGCQNPELDCIDNYMPACASCNINKHQMTVEQFRAAITGYMKHLNGANTQYKMAKRYGLVIEQPKEIIFYFETHETT